MHRHPVLDNDDILNIIFNPLWLDNATLARSARVNRAFSEAALNALWRYPHDFLHLLRILDLVMMPIPGAISTWDVHWQYTLEDRTTPDQWARFRSYARRIRHLPLRMAANRIDPHIYTVLDLRMRLKPLFSGLVHLTWACHAELQNGEFEFVTRVVQQYSHTLRMLHVVGEPRSKPGPEVVEKVVALLDTASAGCPGLRCIDISAWIALPSLRFLDQCSSLETFVCVGIDAAHFLAHCAKLTGLQDLDLQLLPGRSGTELTPRLGALPSLRSLNMVCDTAQTLTSLLETTSSLHVENIMSRISFANSSELLRCSSLIAPRFSGSLRTLTLRCGVVSKSVESVSFQNILRPLLSLHRLEDITLTIGPQNYIRRDGHDFTAVENDDVRDMATAWPNVRTMQLSINVRLAPSLFALGYLAQHCAHLSLLLLYCGRLHDTPIADARLDAVEPLRKHGLKNLFINWDDLQIADGERCRQFLAATFPNVDFSRYTDKVLSQQH